MVIPLLTRFSRLKKITFWRTLRSLWTARAPKKGGQACGPMWCHENHSRSGSTTQQPETQEAMVFLSQCSGNNHLELLKSGWKQTRKYMFQNKSCWIRQSCGHAWGGCEWETAGSCPNGIASAKGRWQAIALADSTTSGSVSKLGSCNVLSMGIPGS